LVSPATLTYKEGRYEHDTQTSSQLNLTALPVEGWAWLLKDAESFARQQMTRYVWRGLDSWEFVLIRGLSTGVHLRPGALDPTLDGSKPL